MMIKLDQLAKHHHSSMVLCECSDSFPVFFNVDQGGTLARLLHSLQLLFDAVPLQRSGHLLFEVAGQFAPFAGEGDDVGPVEEQV